MFFLPLFPVATAHLHNFPQEDAFQAVRDSSASNAPGLFFLLAPKIIRTTDAFLQELTEAQIDFIFCISKLPVRSIWLSSRDVPCMACDQYTRLLTAGPINASLCARKIHFFYHDTLLSLQPIHSTLQSNPTTAHSAVEHQVSIGVKSPLYRSPSVLQKPVCTYANGEPR